MLCSVVCCLRDSTGINSLAARHKSVALLINPCGFADAVLRTRLSTLAQVATGSTTEKVKLTRLYTSAVNLVLPAELRCFKEKNSQQSKTIKPGNIARGEKKKHQHT